MQNMKINQGMKKEEQKLYLKLVIHNLVNQQKLIISFPNNLI